MCMRLYVAEERVVRPQSERRSATGLARRFRCSDDLSANWSCYAILTRRLPQQLHRQLRGMQAFCIPIGYQIRKVSVRTELYGFLAWDLLVSSMILMSYK